MTHVKTRNYWLLSLALFSFFLTWSFAFSLYPIWLNQAIGLDGKQTGIVFSVNAISALLVLPCYGIIQDKLGIKRHLLFFISLMLVLSGPFFIFVYGPLLVSNFYPGVVLGSLFFSIAFIAGVGATETYIERLGRLTGFEFGKARMWGSIGWATATFFTGNLFNINPNINFWFASLSAFTYLIAIGLVKLDSSEQQLVYNDINNERLRLRDVFYLFKLRRFWAFATFVMGVNCIYSVYDQQFPIYFASMFLTRDEGNAMYGYLNSLQVFLEAGGMFVAPQLVNKIGAKNGLILSGALMALRIIGSGLAFDPVSISAMKLLHAAELPILLVSVFKYISANFDQRLSSTIYLVGFQFTSQVVVSCMSFIVGQLYDAIGFASSYVILGLAVSIFVFISWKILINDKLSHEPTIK